MRAVDWAKVVDIVSAASNVRTEFVGDWHRDPWGWPELGFVLKEPVHLSDNLNAGGGPRSALIMAPAPRPWHDPASVPNPPRPGGRPCATSTDADRSEALT